PCLSPLTLSACLSVRRPAGSTLFPYTTLFRSLAERRAVLDHRQRDHAPGVVELHRHHLSYPDTVEIDIAAVAQARRRPLEDHPQDRKSTRLNSSHVKISYAVFCLKKKTTQVGK